MRKFVIVSVAALMSGLVLACGGNGASNNDQGVSVTFLGLYENLPNNNANQGNNTTTGGQGCTRFPNQAAQPTPVPLGNTKGIYAVAGVQNNLFGQFFRSNQIVLDFFIAGAAIQPPSYTGGISIFTGPGENSQGNNNGGAGNGGAGNGSNGNGNGNGGGLRQPQNTSLPPSFSGICNTGFSRVPLLPPQTQEWIAINQSMLPPAPFTIEVTARLVGQSSSGDTIETNSIYIAVDIIPAGTVAADASAYTGSAAANTEGAFQGDYVEQEDGSGSDENGQDQMAEEPLTEPDVLEE